MIKKLLYSLLICLALVGVFVPRIASSRPDSCVYHPKAYQGLAIEQLSQELTNTGLIGRVHGAAAESQLFVLAVREPDNFFSYREFSLLAQDHNTLEALKALNRHDLVCVRGKIIANPSPQNHIAVGSLEILEPWQQPAGLSPYQRTTDLSTQLATQSSLIGKVHAIAEGGKVLVVEVGDGVIPIFVAATEDTQHLYRGDIIQLAYQIQTRPDKPVHLRLDTSIDQPLKIIDAIASWHNQPTTLTGQLVKFPQSPQLKFDVYGIEVETQGIKRYFTLVNFDNLAEFDKIRHKLAKIWDDNAATAQSGRNMLINPQVTIEAKGIAKIISPEQANPQILLNSGEDVILAPAPNS